MPTVTGLPTATRRGVIALLLDALVAAAGPWLAPRGRLQE